MMDYLRRLKVIFSHINQIISIMLSTKIATIKEKVLFLSLSLFVVFGQSIYNANASTKERDTCRLYASQIEAHAKKFHRFIDQLSCIYTWIHTFCFESTHVRNIFYAR